MEWVECGSRGLSTYLTSEASSQVGLSLRVTPSGHLLSKACLPWLSGDVTTPYVLLDFSLQHPNPQSGVNPTLPSPPLLSPYPSSPTPGRCWSNDGLMCWAVGFHLEANYHKINKA